MASLIIPLLSRSELNASFLGSDAEQTISLPTVNVVPFDYATLIVRVHEATWSSGAYFLVEGYASYPTVEDAREFIDSSLAITTADVRSATFPAVGASIASTLPMAIKFVAKLHMSTTAASWFAVVSVDLLLRSKARSQSCGCSKAASAGAVDGDFALPPVKTTCAAECGDGASVSCTAGAGQSCGANDMFGCWVMAGGAIVSSSNCINTPAPPGSESQMPQLKVDAPRPRATCSSHCGVCKGDSCTAGAWGCIAKNSTGAVIPSESHLCLTPPPPNS